MLEVKGLDLVDAASGRRLAKVPALHVGRGEIVALTGPSGSGKTLTALTVAGLLPSTVRVSAGEARLHGEDLLAASERRLTTLRGAEIGLMFQDPATALDPVRRCGEQVAFPLRLRGDISRTTRERLALEALARVGFGDSAALVAGAFPGRLSGGAKQRVMLAMATILGPSLLIADEPTSALDARARRKLLDLLEGLRQSSGMSVLLITHDRVAAAAADRVVPVGDVVSDATFAAHPARPAGHGVAAATTILKGVTKRFGPADSPWFTLSGIDLELRPGERVGLVGHTGSGKSTLARIAAGLDGPDAGSVTTPRPPKSQLVFQSAGDALDPLLTVGESLSEALGAAGVPRTAHDERAGQSLAAVGLDPEHAARLPSELSGGQRQRATLARALAVEPDLLIADETMAALDRATAKDILELLARAQAARPFVLVMVSHDIEAVSAFCDRVVVLEAGRVVADGPPGEVIPRDQAGM